MVLNTLPKIWSDMSPEQIQAYVVNRLAGHAGPPLDEARGEPIWAVLELAFREWRQSPAQLAAFNDSLVNVLRATVAHTQTESFAPACLLAASISALHNGWSLPLPPDLAAALQSFSLGAGNAAWMSDDEAQIAVLDMLAAMNALPAKPLEQAFTKTVSDMDWSKPDGRLPYLKTLGKALLGAQSGHAQVLPTKQWRHLFKCAWRTVAGKALIDDLLFWARVMSKDKAAREIAAKAALVAIDGCDLGRLDCVLLEQRICRRFDGVDWPEAPAPQSLIELRDAKPMRRASGSRYSPHQQVAA